MKKILLLIFCYCLCFSTAYADTHTATTCSSANVQAAINAASTGDTVQVPAGSCTWSSQVTVSGKALTLQGAGIDQTIITDNAGSGGALSITVSATNYVRVVGFTFNDSAGSTYGPVRIEGTAAQVGFRFDHNKINNPGSRGISIWGVYGLIDHCTIVNASGGGAQAVTLFGDDDAAWLRPQTLGTSNAVYIEDNTFDFSGGVGDGATDAYAGARFVFRHNTVIGTVVSCHGLDSGGYRSPHTWEIYNNTFTSPVHNVFTAMNLRGGSGVIFNNTVSSAFNGFASLRNYRSCDACSVCGSWGICNGSNSIDGNTSGQQGWPCADQIGRTTGTGGWPASAQQSSPVYGWNNTLGGSAANLSAGDDCSRETIHIAENRDFHNGVAKPGYSQYTYPHPLQVGSLPPPPDSTFKVTESGTGTGNVNNPPSSSGSGGSGGGGGCFIATAAYGSYLDPHVYRLRNIRDRYLLTNSLGQTVVNIYYMYSPPLADFISKHETIKIATRWALTLVVCGIDHPYTVASLFLMIPVGIALAQRRRKLKRSH